MNDVAALQERIRKLESVDRRSCRVFYFVALLAVAGLFLTEGATGGSFSASSEEELRAKRFVLVDDRGECRASLGFAPGVMMHGKSEPGFESTVLSLNASSNKTAITLMVMHDGRPGIMLIGADGKPRITARLLPDGNPSVWFIDQEQKERMRFALEADGRPSIAMLDAKGKETLFTP